MVYFLNYWHLSIFQQFSTFFISWDTNKIQKFCSTARNIYFFADWQKINMYNFNSFTLDSYCCIGCCHFLFDYLRGKRSGPLASQYRMFKKFLHPCACRDTLVGKSLPKTKLVAGDPWMASVGKPVSSGTNLEKCYALWLTTKLACGKTAGRQGWEPSRWPCSASTQCVALAGLGLPRVGFYRVDFGVPGAAGGGRGGVGCWGEWRGWEKRT